MVVEVTKENVIITQGSVINSDEIGVNRCEFILPSCFEGLSVTAVFNGIPVPLNDCECWVPSLEKGNAVLGVYAYKEVDGEIEIMYSPKPTVFYVSQGSYTDEINESAVAQISQYEQYCKMILESSQNALNDMIIKEFDPETSPEDNQVYSAKATLEMGVLLSEFFDSAISEAEQKSNKVNAISENSRDDKYPSAKAVYEYGQTLRSDSVVQPIINSIGQTYSDKLYEHFNIDRDVYPYIAIYVNEYNKNNLVLYPGDYYYGGLITELYFLRQNDTSSVTDCYIVRDDTVVDEKSLEEIVEIFLEKDSGSALSHGNTVSLPTNVRTYTNFIPLNGLTNNITTFDMGDTLRDEMHNIAITEKEMEIPTLLVPETQIDIDVSSGGTRIGTDMIKEGKVYKVVLDGVEYECVCKINHNSAGGYEYWYYLGNFIFNGLDYETSKWNDYEDSGEPFCIIQPIADDCGDTMLNASQSSVLFSLIRYDYKKVRLDWVSYVDAVNSRKETTANKTRVIDGYSTDLQYPSAKAVKDYVNTVIGGIENGSY